MNRGEAMEDDGYSWGSDIFGGVRAGVKNIYFLTKKVNFFFFFQKVICHCEFVMDLETIFGRSNYTVWFSTKKKNLESQITCKIN